jgi:importin-7
MSVTEMSQHQPQLYANLTAALGPEEQQVVKAAFENADKIATERQQQLAAAAVAANAAPAAQAQPNGTG